MGNVDSAALRGSTWRRGGSPSAVVARRLLPLTVGLPLVVALLRLEGEKAGLYSAAVGVLIMAGFSIVGSTLLLAWTIRSLDRLDRERGDAEAAVRRAHEQHRALARNFPDGAIVLFDGELRHLIADGAGLAAVGLSAARIEGRTIWEVFPAEVCAALEPPYRAALAGTESTFEYCYRERTYLVRVVPVRDEPTGSVWGGSVMVSDISARKHEEREMRLAEARIRQSEARLAEAQRTAQLGSWEWDPRRDEVVWSDELYRIYGLEPGSWQPSFASFRERIHPDDHAKVKETIQQALDHAAPFTLEYRIIRPDGTIRWLQGRGGTASNDAGGVMLRGTAQDITERKDGERESDRLRAELHQAQKLEAVGQLASGVAHEFNNTLMAITGHGSLLLQKVEAGPLRRDVEQIVGAAERAGGLTRQLLAFGRKQVLQPCVVQLNDVVTRSVSLLQPLIGSHISLLSNRDPLLPATVADPAQVEQVVVNLVLNARDAIAERGTITITTASVELARPAADAAHVRPGRYLILCVRDDGCGMDEATRARIFEPFFTTKSTGSGSGLGLSTAFGIARQGGGGLTVESAPGRGSTFTLYIPAVTEVSAGVGTASDRSPDRPCEEQSRSGKEALVVDDEPSVRDVCAELLGQAGFTVQSAANAEEALELLEGSEAPIDLLLTDVVMPGMGGPELADRAAQLYPQARIVYMSGYSGDLRGGHPMAADALVLQKPFTGAELTRAVSTVLSDEIDRSRPEPTCVVADDHPSVLDAVCRVLEGAGIRVIGRAADAREALAQVARHAPDVVLLDIAMPGLAGLAATTQIRQASPATRILLYTGHVEGGLVEDALAAGAQGLILKSSPLTELIEAVKAAAEGAIYVDQSLSGGTGPPAANEPKLSGREQQVLCLLADGNTNDQAARTLAISADTVQTHVRNAMKKLGADTRTQAVAAAMRHRLIQ